MEFYFELGASLLKFAQLEGNDLDEDGWKGA